MAIDRKRLAEFRKQLTALQKSVGFQEHWLSIAAKILDAISKELFAHLTTSQQRQLLQKLFRPDNAQFVDEVFRAFNATLEIVNTLYDDLGVDIQRDFSKIRAIEKINRTYLGDYEEDAVRDVHRELRIGLFRNENVRQITKRLAGVGGKVTFFADTIARTQIKGYGRTAKAEKARIGEVFFHQYVGIIRPTTRPFCEALINTTHHIDDINKMRNGNLEPVVQFCGGWNCYHDWEPDPRATKSTVAHFQEVGKMRVKTEANINKLIKEYPNKLKRAREKK